MSAILVGPGGADKNPAIVNAFSVGDMPYTEITVPLGGASYFILPYDESRTQITIFPYLIGDDCYVTPYGINALSGFPIRLAGEAVSLNYALHGRLLQSEWYITGSLLGGTIGVGCVRAELPASFPATPRTGGPPAADPVDHPAVDRPRINKPTRWPRVAAGSAVLYNKPL